jgi:glycosyltransferase involved in cell wall biosynthesis
LSGERIVWYRTGKMRQFGGGERVLLEGLRCFGDMGADARLLLHEPLSSETGAFFAESSAKIEELPGFSLAAAESGRSSNRGAQFVRRVRAMHETLTKIAPTFLVADSPIECRFLWLYSLGGRIPLPPVVTFIHGSPFQFADDSTKYAYVFRRHFSEIRGADPVYREMIPDNGAPMRPVERARLEFECAALRAGVRMARRAFVLSHKNRIEVERLYGIHNAIVACPGGFSSSAIRSVRASAAPPSSHQISKPILLSLCRLIAKKRVDVLVRAFHTFVNRNPASKATLVIGGEGPAKSSLQQLVGELGIAARVHFAGFIHDADLLAWYAACQVFLNADNADYDLTVMNALAAGRKIVISTQYEVPAGLSSLRRFFFVSPPTTDGYAETIARALLAPGSPLGDEDRGELEALTWERYFGRVLDESRCAIGLQAAAA